MDHAELAALVEDEREQRAPDLHTPAAPRVHERLAPRIPRVKHASGRGDDDGNRRDSPDADLHPRGRRKKASTKRREKSPANGGLREAPITTRVGALPPRSAVTVRFRSRIPTRSRRAAARSARAARS